METDDVLQIDTDVSFPEDLFSHCFETAREALELRRRALSRSNGDEVKTGSNGTKRCRPSSDEPVMGPPVKRARLSKRSRYPTNEDVRAATSEPRSSSGSTGVERPSPPPGVKIFDPVIPPPPSLESVLAAKPAAVQMKEPEPSPAEPPPTLDEPFKVFNEFGLQIPVKISTIQGKRSRDRVWRWWHPSGKITLKFDAQGKISFRKLDYTKPFFPLPR